jgi:hypothetical protein
MVRHSNMPSQLEIPIVVNLINLTKLMKIKPFILV